MYEWVCILVGFGQNRATVRGLLIECINGILSETQAILYDRYMQDYDEPFDTHPDIKIDMRSPNWNACYSTLAAFDMSDTPSPSTTPSIGISPGLFIIWYSVGSDDLVA